MTSSSQRSLDDQAVQRTYRRLVRYVLPYRKRLLVGVVFGMIFGGSTAGMLYGLRNTLEQLFNPDVSFGAALAVAAILPAWAVVRGVGDFMSRYLVGWVGRRVIMDLRGETFAHIHEMPVLYFTGTRSGELISRATNDTGMLEHATSSVFRDIIREPFVLIASAAYLFYLDAQLALISLVLFPICILPVALFGRRVRRFTRQGQERLAGLVSILQETIHGVKVVKAFGMEEYETKRFEVENKKVFRRGIQVLKARAFVEPIVVLISLMALSLALLYAKGTSMTHDTFITFAAALVVLYAPVKALSRIHLTVQQASGAADRVFEILDTESAVKEAPDAKPLEGPFESLVMEDVSFAYEQAPVLRNINISAGAGQCIALVGSSGSGKSTLVSLIPRFFDVTGGRVLMNGQDIRDLTIESLRDQIGIVSQETILFNDTVANNIAYGHSEASRDTVIEAAKRANAHEFIIEMEDGYDTEIGERGLRLSGGQSQRLAIARAILRNPSILILDEATSALDTESERLVQEALNELMTGRTVFAIAHRLSTIRHADHIVVLDQGRIVEEGKHEDLLKKGGVYHRLHDMQFREPATAGEQ